MVSWTSLGRGQRSTSTSLAALSTIFLGGGCIEACTFDWDAYDPRIDAASSSSSSSSSEGAGGMSSSSSSSSGAAGGGGMSNSTSSSSSGMGGGGLGGSGGMGGGGMAGSGGMGGSPGPCGGMYLLTENFEQPIDKAWLWQTYAGPGTSVGQQNGQWVLTLPANSTTSHYASLQSQRLYDLRDNEMTVEVLAVPNPATTAQTSFMALFDDANNVRFQYEKGTIYFASTKNGNNSVKGQVVFDPIQHHHWRMREQAGAFSWETSPDGMNWTVRAQTPTSTVLPLEHVYFIVDTYVSGMQMSPGETRYDNINGGATPMGNFCPTNQLTDDFNDGVRAQAWARSSQNNGCTFMETGGELVIMPPMTASAFCGYSSASAYDLTSNAASVEVPLVPNTAADTGTYLTLAGKDGLLEMAQEGTDLFMRYEKPGMSVDLAAIQYDPTMHRWWRIRESNGKTYWETSANGTAWTERAQATNPIGVKELDIHLAAGTGSIVPNPGEARFDRFNLGP